VDVPEPFHNRKNVTCVLLITGLLVSTILSAAYLLYSPRISSINNKTTDVVMALAGTRPVSGAVVIVDIDDNSLAHYGQWPWPRHRLAQLLRAINASGAASIGLDLILAEPDRTSSNHQPINPEHEPGSSTTTSGKLPYLQNHDQDLADTLTQGPYVLGYQFLFKNSSKTEISCGLHPPTVAWVTLADAEGTPANFFTAQGVVCNRPLFSNAVTNSGFLNATPDSDGILRRVPMLIGFNDRLYPSLTLAMLMNATKTHQIGIQRRENGRLDLIVANRSISIDTSGNMMVQFYRRANAIARVSAADLLSGNTPLHLLRNTFVLVGFSAAGLEQVYQTSAGPVRTHATVHAEVLENLLSDRQVLRTRDFLSGEVLIGLFVTACAILSIAWLTIAPSAVVCMTLLAASWIVAVFVFQVYGYLFSPLLPTVLVSVNFSLLTIVKTWKFELAARERAESTLILLKSSEKNLNSIIKTIPDIIFRLDTAGHIIFISPAILKYTASADALIGQPIFDLVPPDDLPKVRYNLVERRTGKRATDGLELRLLLPGTDKETEEEIRYFSISAEGIYQGDNPCPDTFIGTQGILRDITEQKMLEEKLLNAQKLEAIGSLAAGVAHDLNNILAGLVTYPDLLLLELPKDSPLRDKISIIQRSGKSAAAIVQDLLTLGRRGVKTNEVVDVNTVVSDYLASLEFAATWKHHPEISLETRLAPDLMRIKGSKVHLAKAIMNLLTNAVEAMPAGGKITLSSYNRYLDVSVKVYEEIPPGEYVCVCVADEGIGIDDEDRRRIFEPFYSKKSMKRSGSGLGMTVIWATIKDHGGYVDLQSREGQGTQFTLYFPATREQEEFADQRVVLEDYVGTEQVLVVDDMPEQLQIATGMLTKLGYAVTAVASGEAAVQYLTTHLVGLVVLDMIMPGGMDGLETYMRILDIRPGMRAIVTSGFSESERVKALQQLGAGAYIQKPYTLEKLGMAVRKELDRPL
jgi:PAS domain S-box-containing protein